LPTAPDNEHNDEPTVDRTQMQKNGTNLYHQDNR
jgi:hypothetical protein